MKKAIKIIKKIKKIEFFYKKVLTLRVLYCIVSLVADEAANNFIIKSCAGMAELADAQASGACGSNIVRVQVPLPALFFSSILPKSIWHCHSSSYIHRRSSNDSHPVQSWLHRMDILSP